MTIDRDKMETLGLGLVAVVLAALIALVTWQGKTISKLQATNEGLLAVKTRLEDQLTAEREAVRAHAAEVERLNEETDQMRKELSDVYESDETARAWRDDPCPAGVQCRLRFQE